MNFFACLRSLLPGCAALLALGVASFTVGAGATTPPSSYEVTGTVRGPVADSRVTIAHDEIPGFMAAMTMRFELAEPQDAARLSSGTRVKFRLRQIEERFLADQFVVLGAAEDVRPTTAGRGPRLRPGDALPAITLVNERNEPLTRESFLGRFTVVTFIFTRCPVPEFCPAMATKFAALQRQIAAMPAGSTREVRLLSITLDPEFDRPEILAVYGEAIGAKPDRWNLATGTKEEITALAKSFAVFAEWNGITLDHTLCTALIGPDGRIVEIWRGNGWKADDVLRVANDGGAVSDAR